MSIKSLTDYKDKKGRMFGVIKVNGKKQIIRVTNPSEVKPIPILLGKAKGNFIDCPHSGCNSKLENTEFIEFKDINNSIHIPYNDNVAIEETEKYFYVLIKCSLGHYCLVMIINPEYPFSTEELYRHGGCLRCGDNQLEATSTKEKINILELKECYILHKIQVSCKACRQTVSIEDDYIAVLSFIKDIEWGKHFVNACREDVFSIYNDRRGYVPINISKTVRNNFINYYKCKFKVKEESESEIDNMHSIEWYKILNNNSNKYFNEPIDIKRGERFYEYYLKYKLFLDDVYYVIFECESDRLIVPNYNFYDYDENLYLRKELYSEIPQRGGKDVLPNLNALSLKAILNDNFIRDLFIFSKHINYYNVFVVNSENVITGNQLFYHLPLNTRSNAKSLAILKRLLKPQTYEYLRLGYYKPYNRAFNYFKDLMVNNFTNNEIENGFGNNLRKYSIQDIYNKTGVLFHYYPYEYFNFNWLKLMEEGTDKI